MVVAGIDASTKKSGIAIMKDGELIFRTLIDLGTKDDAMIRIPKMMIKICEVLDQYDIDIVCMEKSILKTNVDTVQKLSNLAGGIMLYCAQNDIKFKHPTPPEWRKKVGLQQSSKIKRDVLKAEAILAVQQEYGLNVGDDVAEAILLARSMFDLPKVNVTEDDLWGN